MKVLKNYKMKNMFGIWSSILTLLMIVSRWVVGKRSVCQWVSVKWSVDRFVVDRRF